MSKFGNIKLPVFCKENKDIENYFLQVSVAFQTYDIDESDQVGLFLTSLSSEIFGEVSKSVIPKDILKLSFAEIKKAFIDKYEEKKILPLWIVDFYKLERNPSEPIETFYDKLWTITKHCEFKDPDERVKEKLWTSVLYEPYFTDKLLNWDYKNGNSHQLLNLVSSLMTSYKHSGPTASVHKVKTGTIKKPQSESSEMKKEIVCFYCSKKGHIATECWLKTKYKSSTCENCKKKGHIARFCKTKQDKNSVKKSFKEKTHCVEENEEDLELNNILTSKKDNDVNSVAKLMKVVDFDGCEIKMELDSGAVVSLIKESDFKQLNKPLLPDSTSLQSFTGDKLKVLGKTVLDNVKFEGQTLPNVQLLVVDNKYSNNLLGRDILIRHPDYFKLFTRMINSVENKINQYKVDSNKPIKDFQCKLYLKSDAKPVFQRARTVPYQMKEGVEKTLKEMVDQGYIESIKYSDWASPIVPVMKPNKTVRICADLKKVNLQHQTITYPIPIIDDLLNEVSGKKYYSKIDMSNAYLQLEVEQESKDSLVINTHLGLFRFNRLPFGLSSSPAIFQKFMDQLLNDIDNTKAYLDDIIIVGDTKAEHDLAVERVLTRLEERNVSVNFKKSVFGVPKLSYLGYSLSSEGYSPLEEKLKAIKDVPKPKNVTEVKSFLGLVSYYSRFVKNFADIVAPLYDLTQKGIKFVWSTECDNAFENIIKQLTKSNHVLANYDGKSKLILEVDASPIGLGAVLKQCNKSGKESTIFFASRKLQKAELAYAQIDKEALAIIFAVNKFGKFLLGSEFILRTDHKPLIHIFNPEKNISAVANARITRWSLKLSAFRFSIEHISGKNNIVADGLSRLPINDDEVKFVTPSEYINLLEDFQKFKVDIKQLKKSASMDTKYCLLKETVQRGFCHKDEKHHMIKPFIQYKDDLSIHDNLLLYRNRLWIPTNLQSKILKLLHASHYGTSTMKQMARKVVFWPHMDEDIEQITKKL